MAILIVGPSGTGPKPRVNQVHSASASSTSSPPVVQVTVDASRARGKVNESLLGVNQGQPNTVKALRSIGVRWARMDASFEGTYHGKPVYNCKTGAWNPAIVAREAAEAKAMGAKPEVIIDYTPDCLASNVKPGQNPNYAAPDVGPDQARWVHLIKEFARVAIKQLGIRTFEIWNEPDWLFWNAGLSAYLHLYVVTARALETVAHQLGTPIEVGGPAAADVGVKPDTIWLGALFAAVVKNHVPLNFVSWHLYDNDPDAGPANSLLNGFCTLKPKVLPPNTPCWYNPDLDPSMYGRVTREIKAMLAKYPSLHPKLWIDEWNINGGEDPRQNTSFDAAFAAWALSSAQKAGLSRMCFFRASNSIHGDPLNNWGMFHADGAPKPVFETFRFWHEMRGTLLGTTVVHGGLSHYSASIPMAKVGPPGSVRVGATASLMANKRVNVLLWDLQPFSPVGDYGNEDPNPADREVSLTVSDLPGGTGRHWLVKQSVVDARNLDKVEDLGVLKGPSVHLSLEIYGDSVSFFHFYPTNDPVTGLIVNGEAPIRKPPAGTKGVSVVLLGVVVGCAGLIGMLLGVLYYLARRS